MNKIRTGRRTGRGLHADVTYRRRRKNDAGEIRMAHDSLAMELFRNC